MKHAIVITAYTDYLMLRLLCEIFHKDFLIYIHVDKQSKKITDKHIEELNEMDNVYVVRKYVCHWNSLNHLLALIDMSKEALKNPDVNYVHFSTGQDLPIKTNQEIKALFDQSGNKSFLNYHFPDAHFHEEVVNCWKYYHFIYNDCDVRKVPYCDWVKENMEWQKKNNICKKGLGEFTKIYKGIIWSSFTREALEYCYDYIKKHPEYWEDIKYTRIREEFCFHTILFNTPYFEDKIVRDGKHGWKWLGAGQFQDMTYDEYTKLDKQGKLFIRKVSSDQTELINAVLRKISEYRLEGKTIYCGNDIIYEYQEIDMDCKSGFTGLERDAYGWWYKKDGKPDFSYTGMAENEYGWWYVKNGRIDYTYKGLVKNELGWWYVKEGKVDYTYKGLVKNEFGWWYVKEGKIDYTYEGMAQNEHGMWKCQKGQPDFSYNGEFEWDGRRYNVVKGRVQ